MRKSMVIQLPGQWPGADEGDADVSDIRTSWVLRDEDRPAGSLFHGDLKEAAAQAAGARVTVLVPGEDVLLAQAELPEMKGQKLAKAVPFALEEQLADDVEVVHVAIGERDTRGKLANAVVLRHKIESWLDRLRAAGLQPDVLSPEVFGVHWDNEAESTKWSLVVDGLHALLRTGPQTGLAFDAENLIPVLQAALYEAGELVPSTLSVVICGDELYDSPPGKDELTALCKESSVEVTFEQYDDSCSLLLAQGFDENNAINLLQGDYSRKEQFGKLLRPWKPALILVAAWIVIQVGILGIDYGRLSSLATRQQAEIESIFKEAMPGSRLVKGREKVRIEEALKKLRGGSGNQGLLGLLANAGKIIKETNGIRLRSLRYKDFKLDVDIDLPDLQSLDKLKQRLTSEAGLKVDIVSASQRNGKVESRLSLGGKSA